jgi:hypothetical protein
MHDRIAPAEEHLIAQLDDTARGPKRNGVFALWLFVRVCGEELPPTRISTRGRRRRLADLERRLSSLSLPPGLRQALGGSLRAVESLTPEGAVAGLKLLMSPAREHLGSGAGEAVGLATRHAKGVIRRASEVRQ